MGEAAQTDVGTVPPAAATSQTSDLRGGRVIGMVWSQSQAEVIAGLAHELHDQPSLGETVDRVVESAAALVGCDHAGMLVVGKGHRLDAFTAHDPVAFKADRLQVEWQEGPGFTAVTEGSSILVPDVAAEVRWPRWTAGMRRLDLNSALVVRLWTSQEALGVLTLYARAPRAFDAEALAVAEIVGRHGSIALASARREETLYRALDARKLIGQAQGILMERFSLDPDAAFEVLRRYSQSTNTKLSDIARGLVESRTLPEFR